MLWTLQGVHCTIQCVYCFKKLTCWQMCLTFRITKLLRQSFHHSMHRLAGALGKTMAPCPHHLITVQFWWRWTGNHRATVNCQSHHPPSQQHAFLQWLQLMQRISLGAVCDTEHNRTDTLNAWWRGLSLFIMTWQSTPQDQSLIPNLKLKAYLWHEMLSISADVICPCTVHFLYSYHTLAAQGGVTAQSNAVVCDVPEDGNL